MYRCSGLTPYELKKLHSSYKENRSETRFELWEFLFLILTFYELLRKIKASEMAKKAS